MAIDSVEARRIARLALLDPGESEGEIVARQLEPVLEYMGMLDELDLGDAAPEESAHARDDSLRDDEPRDGLEREEALCSAPDPSAGFFRVPRSLPE